ncbi:MAG TPA: HD domain-containing protein [Chloroflexota bacterium]|nr:HD domain-containing protein [Chloroflexota bacterium]
MSPIDHLAGLFAGEGVRSYLGEDVSLATHMLQAAMLAERSGAPDHLAAAALLHDVGHFAEVGRRRGDEHVDYQHEAAGADWLAQWFPLAVTEPVRLHVMAKRYLCTVEPGYFARLSPASVHTLALQGGVLTDPEARAFEQLAHAQSAIAVRRWDEAAKDPLLAPPPFEHFADALRRLLTSS